MNIDIQLVLDKLGIQGKKVSSNEIKINCINPEHIDKNPSLFINLEKGIFQCWSCGHKGNIFSLVKELTGKNLYDFLGIENNDFVNSLSNKYEYKEDSFSLKNISISGTLYEVKSDPTVYSYLLSRGMSDNFIKDFRIKFCKRAVMNGMNFYNRVCIPVFENRYLISMIGRDFTGKSNIRYLYPKNSCVDTLFNIDNLDRKSPLYVVEGIMDIVWIYENISRNVTCLFGSKLGKRQKEMLITFNEIILIPDNDNAGIELIHSIDKVLEKEYYIVTLPDQYKDPSECPLEELKKAIDNKILAIEYYKKRHGRYIDDNLGW